MRDETYTPFEGKRTTIPVPMRVIRRFAKPGHVAEIRERRITTVRALEWLVFVDGSLIESRMYHGARATAYAGELEECCASLKVDGWVEDPTARMTLAAG